MSRLVPTLTIALGAAALALPATALATYPGANGVIAYSSSPAKDDFDGGLFGIDAGGATAFPILDDESYDEYGPSFSPDGKTLAWVSYAGGKYDGIYAGPYEAAGSKRIAKASEPDEPTWSPDGKTLLFVDHARGLLRVPSDGSAKPTLLLKRSAAIDYQDPIYVANGTAIVYTRFVITRKNKVKRSELWTAAPDGTAPRLLAGGAAGPRLVGDADLSPDGTKLVYVAGAGKIRDSLWVSALDGSAATKILSAPAKSLLDGPVWSPDGSRIALTRDAVKDSGKSALLTVDPNGGSTKILKTPSHGPLLQPSWQPLH